MNPLLIRRRGMMGAQGGGGLPQGYTLLQYVTNPNSAYIQTNVVLAKTDTIELKFNVVNHSGSRFCFRCEKDADASGYNFSIGYAGAECYLNQHVRIFASRTGITTLRYENYIWTHIEWNRTYNASGETYGLPLKPMTMLAIVTNGTPANFFPDEFYYMKVEGKCDLVPVISPNNEVGFYDLIGRIFYGSANAASFVAGPTA